MMSVRHHSQIKYLPRIDQIFIEKHLMIVYLLLIFRFWTVSFENGEYKFKNNNKALFLYFLKPTVSQKFSLIKIVN